MKNKEKQQEEKRIKGGHRCCGHRLENRNKSVFESTNYNKSFISRGR